MGHQKAFEKSSKHARCKFELELDATHTAHGCDGAQHVLSVLRLKRGQNSLPCHVLLNSCYISHSFILCGVFPVVVLKIVSLLLWHSVFP